MDSVQGFCVEPCALNAKEEPVAGTLRHPPKTTDNVAANRNLTVGCGSSAQRHSFETVVLHGAGGGGQTLTLCPPFCPPKGSAAIFLRLFLAVLVRRYPGRERFVLCKLLEARGGIEPPNKGFADLCLTTWLPRRLKGFSSQNTTTRFPAGSRDTLICAPSRPEPI